jgi:hypothetical protein
MTLAASESPTRRQIHGGDVEHGIILGRAVHAEFEIPDDWWAAAGLTNFSAERDA